MSTAKIIQKQQEVYGIITEINQIVEHYSIKNSKSFDYKARITGRLEDNNTEKEVEVGAPLKHFIDIGNCEINLILTWSENCVITSKETRDADPDADPAVAGLII